MRLVVLAVGGWRAWRLLLLTGCGILGMVGLGVVEAHAATPSSLAGETFTTQNPTGSGSTLTGGCGGTTTFSVSGTAAGPFPGTFTESGSFTTLDDGSVTQFSTSFTINSTSGTVTGTEMLAGDNLFTCNADSITASNFPTVYTATINGSAGPPGTATFNLFGIFATGRVPDFSQSFASIGAVQKQCKHGGWRSFGTVFKNQGDCVAFFATRGKNPPGRKSSKPSAQYTVCQSGCRYGDLQSAILAVEKGTITNPITVGPGHYGQTSALVRGTVVIRGVGDGTDPATDTILDGSGSGTVISLEKPGSLTISGVEITRGNSDSGGGIFNEAGTVTFDGPVLITNNNATAFGGGIFNDAGTVTFAAGSNATITDNNASVSGGGLSNDNGTVNFDPGSTVSITGNTPNNCDPSTACPPA